ncbi:MAG: hypothetical protein M9894_08560 [Planctomycetes bacterium]|nr:hypothetical protein [Planctomycetota bacterium]
MARRDRLGLGVLVAAALGGAAVGGDAALSLALQGGRWRRGLAGVDLVSLADEEMALARALIPPDAAVGYLGSPDVAAPGDHARFSLLRYTLAPRQVLLDAADAPYVILAGPAPPGLGARHRPLARLGPSTLLLGPK